MEQKPVPANDSPGFLCPSCGTSAFEVVATQRNLSEGGGGKEFLVMQCLACLELFYHKLGSEGPYGMPSDGDERIFLASDVSGSSTSMRPSAAG